MAIAATIPFKGLDRRRAQLELPVNTCPDKTFVPKCHDRIVAILTWDPQTPPHLLFAARNGMPLPAAVAGKTFKRLKRTPEKGSAMKQ